MFKKNVLDIGHTLLVLQWDNPIPLTRAWCIWEIFCTCCQDANGKTSTLEVIMSPNDERALRDTLALRFDEVVEKVSRVVSYSPPPLF